MGGKTFDYKLDSAGKHNLSLRGTLQRNVAGPDSGTVPGTESGICWNR